MESVGVLQTSIGVRHKPTQVLPSMSSSQPRNSLKATSSLHPEFACSPSELANMAGPSRHMISSPLRTCSPIIARVPPPPPIDTSVATSSKGSPQPLTRVPTEPGSAPPPRQQPSADELAVLGIKVRDFAFEPSNLPRVPTVQRPFFRDLKRQFDETPEEAEKRKLNEARRLEFNTPRRKNETPEERGARVLAFGSPRANDFPNNSMRFVPRLDESSLMKLLGLPSFGDANSFSNANADPTMKSMGTPDTSLTLQRQPSEVQVPQTKAGLPSTSSSAGILFRTPITQRYATPSHVGNTAGVETHEPHTKSRLPRLDLEWLIQSSQESQSQFFSIKPQAESQDTGISSESQPPGLSTSQADSEMDEEYIKTPLVTPNGSLVFDDGDHFHLSLHNSAADLERTWSDAGNVQSSSGRHLDTSFGSRTTQTDSAIIDSSTLPESQMAELLAPAGTGGIEEDVSASQMGLESQDLLSQPAWQQQSQSQFQVSSQGTDSHQESQVEDVEMPESQPEYEESRVEAASCTSTVTPTASRRSSTLLSPARAYASVCSNNAASSPRHRPIPRRSTNSPSTHHPSNIRTLSPSPSHSLLRRSPSLGNGLSLSRQASISSISSKANPSPSVTNRGKGRYNLRTPSPKKAKLFGSPSFTLAPTSGRRTRSRTQSAPASKRGVVSAVSAGNTRRSKSAVTIRKRATRGGRGKKGNADIDSDVVMGEESNAGQGTS